MTPQKIKDRLAQHHGTENYYRFAFLGVDALYTDGVQDMAETCKAHWLINAVMSYQSGLKNEEFQVWTLTKTNYKTKDGFYWLLQCTDGNGNTLRKQEIEYSDFPLDEIKLYFTNNVLLLPSEN